MDETIKEPEVIENISEQKPSYMPTPLEMVTNPMYNTIGKVLGVDNKGEWNQYYDKVFRIVEWAKRETNKTDPDYLLLWIKEKAREIPSFATRRIDDIHIFATLSK